jgi:hypothetical protein
VNIERLSEPFDKSQIHWRVGSTKGDKTAGMALAYLDSRDVMDRLDKICGIDGWQSDQPWSDGKKLCCRIGIKINGEWVWKSDGAGDTAVEGDKGAFSDALKRAAVSWGIGRYLYQTPNWWVPLEKAGNSYKFTKEAFKELGAKYDQWLLPSRKQKFLEAKVKNRVAYDSFLDAIVAEEIDAAADYWSKIPEHDKASLWLSPTDGGDLDQKTKSMIRSTEFSLLTARAAA